MQTVNIHEAKTHLSRLVDEAAKGKSFYHCQGWKADGQGFAAIRWGVERG
ncbi:MAG: hypothetical protein L6300_04090 [Syntrophaceae bacterium]|nr:hypothetical protein [Syntrophaceae bacterium]